MSIKILVLHDIYSSGITHAISSLCSDNLGAASNNPHGSPNPSPHQSSRPPRWDIIFLSVVNNLWDNPIWTCLMLVMLCEILETYVLECWILMFVFEHVGNALWELVWFMIFVRYVMYMWYLWWLCDICDDYVISFVCLDRIAKTNKKRYTGHFAECNTRQRDALPSA